MGRFLDHYRSDSQYQRRLTRRQNLGSIIKWGAANIPKIFGQGDYAISSNSIISGDFKSGQVPEFSQMGGSMRSVRISHREFIQDVQSSTAFVNASYAINPANSGLFPWLSGMTQNFQEYRFHGLVVYFKSTSSDALNSTNTALGTVIMSTDYNAAAKPFASKQAAENAEFTISGRPSCDLAHGIECDPSQLVQQGHLYISPLGNGLVPTGEDIKTYNMGNFQFMTQGSQATATIGELWVSYDVELIKPIDNLQLNRAACDHFQLFNICDSSSSHLFGANPNFQVLNGIGCTIVSGASASTITWPATATPGQVFMITYTDSGSTVAPLTVGTTPYNAALLPLPTPFSGNNFFYATGSSVTQFTAVWFVTIGTAHSIGNLAQFTMGTGWSIPTVGNGDLIIQQVPANMA